MHVCGSTCPKHIFLEASTTLTSRPIPSLHLTFPRILLKKNLHVPLSRGVFRLPSLFRLIPTDSGLPFPLRGHHSYCCHRFKGVVVGGETSGGKLVDDTIVCYDMFSQSWSVFLHNDRASRADGGAVYKRGWLYWFGGMFSSGPTNTLNVMDVPDFGRCEGRSIGQNLLAGLFPDQEGMAAEWKAIKLSSSAPSRRRGHSCCVYKGRMWIFGGVDAAGQYSDDLYSFELGPPFLLPRCTIWLHVYSPT